VTHRRFDGQKELGQCRYVGYQVQKLLYSR
jgi:hypothetical protein